MLIITLFEFTAKRGQSSGLFRAGDVLKFDVIRNTLDVWRDGKVVVEDWWNCSHYASIVQTASKMKSWTTFIYPDDFCNFVWKSEIIEDPKRHPDSDFIHWKKINP